MVAKKSDSHTITEDQPSLCKLSTMATDHSQMRPKIRLLLFGILAGMTVGAVVYGITLTPSIAKFMCVGALIGAVVFALSPMVFGTWKRLSTGEWRVEEIELQGVKFTNDASQRKAAWKIFFNIATRIASRRLPNGAGDNGSILKSLYDLFQETRAIIMELHSSMPEHSENVETYALRMLNNTVAPFLEKWHPLWEKWAERDVALAFDASDWGLHLPFREEMSELQARLRQDAISLALIAGIKDPEKYLPK